MSSQLRNHHKIRRKAQLPLSSSMAYFNFAFRDTHEQIYHDIVSSLLPVVYSVEPCHDILYCFYWYTAAAHRSILIAFDQMPERHAYSGMPSSEKILDLVEERINIRLPNLRSYIPASPRSTIDNRTAFEPSRATNP